MYPFFYLFLRISFKGFVGIKQVIKSQLPEQFHPISGKVTKHVYPHDGSNGTQLTESVVGSVI